MRYTQQDFRDAAREVKEIAKGFATGTVIGLSIIACIAGVGYLIARFPWQAFTMVVLVPAALGFWVLLDEARANRLLWERWESRTPKP